ncbi:MULTISPECIES: flagellar type III secretion system pore protein FliP [unclassified Iodidimonas]|jgi:flagellar biosynthetic protein FliP|uniref:flagellar type III secretion system pore protein FliP n=1 Tax=unclassified Iodidimonas TaxID=2626145 RepID=UPI00248244AC|nr:MULTISPECIES: flagellar type III secretion system pore protein FliP [unclassified Iodidimonas]
MPQSRRTAFHLGILLMAAAFMIWPGMALAQSMSFDLGTGSDATLTARLFQVILMITVLSLAPGILIMVTSFVRIVVVLSILRSALGLQQAPPNIVLVSLALFLTAFIMAPTFERAWNEGMRPMINEDVTIEQGVSNIIAPVKSFMLMQVGSGELAFFDALAARSFGAVKDPSGDPPSPPASPSIETSGPGGGAAAMDGKDLLAMIDRAAQMADGSAEGGADAVSLRILLPAFLISELRRAFEIGFLIFMPFLIIDLVVAALLMSMGMMMLPPAIVALPFKVIFFVLINGWQLLAGSLVLSFAG